MPKPRRHSAGGHAGSDPFQIERLASTVERLETEIRDRLDAEQTWAAERDLLRATLVQAPDFQYVKDINCRFVAVNQAVANHHGFADPAEMVGKTDFDIDSSQHASQLFAGEREIMRSGRPLVDLEELHVGRGGKPGWFATTRCRCATRMERSSDSPV